PDGAAADDLDDHDHHRWWQHEHQHRYGDRAEPEARDGRERGRAEDDQGDDDEGAGIVGDVEDAGSHQAGPARCTATLNDPAIAAIWRSWLTGCGRWRRPPARRPATRTGARGTRSRGR